MKNSIFSRINIDWVILLPILLILVIFKIPQLYLPAFWDEAWSYLPAIMRMAERGPSLLPDPQTAELFRGHPLFFYALVSLWIKFFGTSFFAMRLLPLLVSMLLLIVLFYFSKKYFGRMIAATATLFLLIQAVFLAQSSMLLPEMLLALLSLLDPGRIPLREKSMVHPLGLASCPYQRDRAGDDLCMHPHPDHRTLVE